MLVYSLIQMSLRVTNIACITHVTIKLINKGLLINNRWLDSARFQMLFDVVTNKCGLGGHLNFLAQIYLWLLMIETCSHKLNKFARTLMVRNLFFFRELNYTVLETS